MRRFDETEGRNISNFFRYIYDNVSCWAFAWHGIFLLNPSFKSSRAEVEGGSVYFSISIPDYNDIVDNIYLEENI